MYTSHHKDLKILLEATQPASLLVIDPNPEGFPSSYRQIVPGCRIAHVEDNILQQLQTLERHDLGVIANTLEHLNRQTAGMVLARLRDLNTRRFIALVPIGNAWGNQTSYWETGDLLGYGMSLMARYRVDGRPLYLYHYAIESYKPTPDWFNSRHWAHPERWKP